MYHKVVTVCTASLTLNNSTFCPNSVFMCFVWIWEQTAIISLFSINWLILKPKMFTARYGLAHHRSTVPGSYCTAVSTGCRTLDSVVQLVADGITTWRVGRETHQTDRETSEHLYSAWKIQRVVRELPPAVFILVVSVWIIIVFKWNLKIKLKLRIYFLQTLLTSVLSCIHSIKSLSNFQASFMCKL
jgi:hypothetical protein